ncbi:hypothetical protein VTO42DRAFT_36 [Malbranchea cinnamomea]
MPSEGVPKCQRCRRDHKKCSPENRKWPGPKCDRCESYGYECSENVMARRSSQKEDLPRSMRGIMQELSQTKYHQQNAPGDLVVQLPETPVLNSMQHSVQYQSPWTDLFEYLRDIDWFNLRCPFGSCVSDPFVDMFRSPSCPVPDLPGLPLGRRQMYLEAFLESQRLMQHLPNNMSGAEALQESINGLVTRAQRQYPQLTMAYSFEELARACENYVRYGSCWNEFISALQSPEVLLIDPSYSFDINPTTTFESAKKIWLCHDLGLRQFCQKLSGLSQMISNLARTPMNSEERAYLAAKIPDRLEEVLGPRSAPPVATLPSYPASPVSFYPGYGLDSPPIETLDGNPYFIRHNSIGTTNSDESYSSLDGRTYVATLNDPSFNEQIWSN